MARTALRKGGRQAYAYRGRAEMPCRPRVARGHRVADHAERAPSPSLRFPADPTRSFRLPRRDLHRASRRGARGEPHPFDSHLECRRSRPSEEQRRAKRCTGSRRHQWLPCEKVGEKATSESSLRWSPPSRLVEGLPALIEVTRRAPDRIRRCDGPVPWDPRVLDAGPVPVA